MLKTENHYRHLGVSAVFLYPSYLESLAPYTDQERGRLYTALLTYAQTGQEPAFTGNERFIWPTLKAQLDRDAANYAGVCEANRINGKKGGRPPKKAPPSVPAPVVAEEETPENSETEKTEGFILKPKKPKEKEKEKEKEKKKEREKENPGQAAASARTSPQGSCGQAPPLLSSVKEYCKQMGYRCDPERFYNYYAALGWRIGGQPIQDWKAALNNWEKKEEKPYGNLKSKAIRPIGVQL